MQIKPTTSEKELLLRVSSGDQRSFEQLYNLYSPRLYGFLLKLVKKEDIAQELLQEVFMKIWERHATLDPERSFRSYLFRIAENCVVDFFRRAARDKKLGMQLMDAATELYQHIEEAIYARENSAILNLAVNSLPPQRRQVFTLCKFEGKSYKEVSHLLGISVSTISDHLLKASRAIRQYVLLSDHTVTILVIWCIFSR